MIAFSPPLLSICIPTYSRPKELGETLRILEDQITGLPVESQSQIEVIVSDNASPGDPAPPLVARCPRARLIRQASNVGATRNFETCYEQAAGEYVLLLSDDDHLTAGSLATICDCLQQHRPDVLFLPFSPRPETDKPVLSHERNSFIRRFGYYPTLVSACILKRELITPVLGRYLDTNMHHFFYYLTAMERGERFHSIERQVLFCPYEDNAGGYNWFATFGEQLPRIIREFPSKRVEKRALSAVSAHLLKSHVVPTFVRRKLFGYVYNKKFPNDTLGSIVGIVSRNFRGQPAYWFLFIPITLAPSPLLRLAKRAMDLRKSYLLRRQNPLSSKADL